ncbi:SEL1-like repeat protein [Thiosocius teredinicola]|uniref:tetratricopeptide repeat protein n=1 Tax=Thiosocius teredinicola TaxID=1973002 RepID=UPI000F767312
MDEPQVQSEIADLPPQRRSGPWKLILLVAVLTAVGVWLVPNNTPEHGPIVQKPAGTPPIPGGPADAGDAPSLLATPVEKEAAQAAQAEKAAEEALAAQPAVDPAPAVDMTEDTESAVAMINNAEPTAAGGAPIAEPVDDRPGAKARAFITKLRAEGDMQLGKVFEAAESARANREMADAYLLYFFAAREGHAPAALVLGEQADPATRDPDTSVFDAADLTQAHKWYQLAAENGDTEGSKRLTDLRTRVETLAAGGDPEAQRITLLWQ